MRHESGDYYAYSDHDDAVAVELRGGYTFFGDGESTCYISLELTRGLYHFEYSDTDEDVMVTGIAVLLGYQHL